MSTGDDYTPPLRDYPGPPPAQAPESRKETDEWDNAKGGEAGQAGSRGRIRRWLARFKR
jgi:hypothetical protein